MQKIWKDSNDRKTVEGILNFHTVKVLYKLVSKGVIDNIIGVIKEGKESVIILAKNKQQENIILKVYKIKASKFQRMQKYLVGDPRFSNVKRNRRSIVFAWCKKEYSNLKRARKSDVKCPEPIAFLDNVLVMEFIGDKESAPLLNKVGLKDPEKTLKECVFQAEKLYKKAGLVHGDLSPYNILIDKGSPVLIDFSQSVLKQHPLAMEFLERDIKNICNYFEKLGVKAKKEEILGKIIQKN